MCSRMLAFVSFNLFFCDRGVGGGWEGEGGKLDPPPKKNTYREIVTAKKIRKN